MAIVVLLLAGCGFRLQGALTPPAEMERTYVAGVDRHSLFFRELRTALREAGVDVVDDETAATAVFTIAVDHTDQRVLSVSARNVPTEYEVFYTVEYALDAMDRRLIDVQSLTVTRNYTYDSTLVQERMHRRVGPYEHGVPHDAGFVVAPEAASDRLVRGLYYEFKTVAFE